MKKVLFCLLLLPLMLLAQIENWVYRYNETIGDMAYSIVYGGDGNIYAAGNSDDFLVISLTHAGDTNWVYQYNGPGNAYDRAYSVVYGADGNIYAAGYSYINSNITGDFTVISLTAAGDTNWVYLYNGSGNYLDEARSVVYGGDGNIYAAGLIWVNASTTDLIVISLTTAGDTNWVYKYNGPGNGSEDARSIVYGADGNIYAAGGSFGSGTSIDFAVISLTTAGDTNWVYTYNGPGNYIDVAQSIVYGGDGNIYAAGRSTGSGSSDDFTVISLTTAGDTNWVYRHNGSANDWDIANSIVYGADGNIYAAGYITGSGTDDDFAVISLTPAGDTNWVYTYNGPGNSWDKAQSVVYGADGNIYAAGQSYGSGTPNDFTVISLGSGIAVKENNTVIRENSSTSTIFAGPLLLPHDKICKVFDITGRVVMPDKMQPGIYFIEIDGKITQKVVKIR